MENTRKLRSAEIPAHVASQLRGALFPGANVVLGLSGGLDSVCLLHVLAELAMPLRFSLRAVHVNHGISQHAAQWTDFCRGLCLRLGVSLSIEMVNVGAYRGLGPEGAARAARWSALRLHQADFLALAQHLDDQAETLLLQLLRGAGPAGLAGMAANAFDARASAHPVRYVISRMWRDVSTHRWRVPTPPGKESCGTLLAPGGARTTPSGDRAGRRWG